jgi:hypothetical protein
MTFPNNNTSNTIRRKKRLLTSSRDTSTLKIPIIQSNALTKPEPKKKKKRLLAHPPSTALSASLSRQPTLSPPNTTTTVPKSTEPNAPTTKRSIRAASEAIAKREKQRQDAPLSPSPPPPPPPLPPPPPTSATIEEKQPIVKRKRKLNSQKVVIPTNESSSDALVFEETGDVRYAKYLDSSSMKQIPNNEKPAIVIGVPTKKRKLVRAPVPTTASVITSTIPTAKSIRITECSTTNAATSPTVDQVLEREKALDLSQHSILPNSSYIAHLPVSQQPKKRENSVATASCSSMEEAEGSILYTMDNYTVMSDKSSSPPSTFFDAISDFEDMTLHSQLHSEQEEEDEDEDEDEEEHEEEEEPTAQQASTFSFWNSILKPFTK